MEILAGLVDRVSALEAKLSDNEEAKWEQVADNFNGFNTHLSNIYQRLDRIENASAQKTDARPEESVSRT
jgi:BMFP domain-containing protein YqiC